MTDHPRKGKEWRVGDLVEREGARGPILAVADSDILISVPDAIEGEAPAWVAKEEVEHVPIDSPEESAALRAEVARLTKERDELIAAGVDLGDVALHLRGPDGSI